VSVILLRGTHLSPVEGHVAGENQLVFAFTTGHFFQEAKISYTESAKKAGKRHPAEIPVGRQASTEMLKIGYYYSACAG